MLSSSNYLPSININNLHLILDYLCKTEQISKHIYNMFFEDKSKKYKKYVVVKLKKE